MTKQKNALTDQDFFREALRSRLDDLGHGGISKIAERAKITQPALSKIKDGDRTGRIETLFKISEALGTTYSEMVEYGKRLKGIGTNKTTPALAAHEAAQYVMIPVLTGGDINSAMERVAFHKHWLIHIMGLRPEDCMVIKLADNSATPFFYTGDSILIHKKNRTPRSGEGTPYAFQTKEGVVKVRWMAKDQGRYYTYGPLRFERPGVIVPPKALPKNATILGQVVWHAHVWVDSADHLERHLEVNSAKSIK